jgi:hypothetical protein
MIQVLVATGLLGGLGLLGMQIVDNTSKGMKGNEAKTDFTILRASVHDVVFNKNFCQKAFLDITGSLIKFPPPGPSDDLNEIVMDTGVGKITVAKVGKKAGSVKISKLYLRYQKDNSTPPVDIPPIPNTPNPGQTTHYLELVMEGEGKGSTRKISNAKLPEKLTLVTEADLRMSSCGGSGGAVGPMSLVSFSQNAAIIKKAGNVDTVVLGSLAEAGANNIQGYSPQNLSAPQAGSGVYKITFDTDMSPTNQRFIQITANNFGQSAAHTLEKQMSVSLPGTDYYWIDNFTLVVVIYTTVNSDGDKKSKDRMEYLIPTSGRPNANTSFSVLIN